MSKSATHSYGQILKSSALIGVSSLLDIGFRIVRVKLMALWLGPAGVGLMGLYTSIADLAVSVAALGVDNSGVRQIAQAVGTQEPRRIALTVYVLRRACLVLGIAGAALLALFARPSSRAHLRQPRRAASGGAVSRRAAARLVSSGQMALLRGMRKIGDLARMEVLGAFIATLVTIPLIYFLRRTASCRRCVASRRPMTLTSWWYSRKVELGSLALPRAELARETAALLKLGFAFMVSGLATMGVAYAVRVIVLRELGFEAAGLYQSAWTIGGLYVGLHPAGDGHRLLSAA